MPSVIYSRNLSSSDALSSGNDNSDDGKDPIDPVSEGIVAAEESSLAMENGSSAPLSSTADAFSSLDDSDGTEEEAGDGGRLDDFAVMEEDDLDGKDSGSSSFIDDEMDSWEGTSSVYSTYSGIGGGLVSLNTSECSDGHESAVSEHPFDEINDGEEVISFDNILPPNHRRRRDYDE